MYWGWFCKRSTKFKKFTINLDVIICFTIALYNWLYIKGGKSTRHVDSYLARHEMMRRTACWRGWAGGWTWPPPRAGTRWSPWRGPRRGSAWGTCRRAPPSPAGCRAAAASGGRAGRSRYPPDPLWRCWGRPWPACTPGRGARRCTGTGSVNAWAPPRSWAGAGAASHTAAACLSRTSASCGGAASWCR